MPPQRSLSVQEQPKHFLFRGEDFLNRYCVYLDLHFSCEILRNVAKHRYGTHTLMSATCDRGSRVKVSYLFMRGRIFLTASRSASGPRFNFREGEQTFHANADVVFSPAAESLPRSMTGSFRSLKIATLSRE